MSNARVDCPITIPDDLQIGEFVNAFRVLPEAGTECILDFLVYSTQAQQARVVARLRIQKDFVSAIQERLASFLIEFPSTPPISAETPPDVTKVQLRGNQVTLPNGDIIFWALPGTKGSEEN